MNLARVVRKIAAFFARDFAIARGYRGALVLETLEALFGVATFYYLSRFVSSPELSSALPDGDNYFAFALVGFAFFDYLSVSLTAFDSSIEEARQNRTLEALLVTQTPLPVILAGWPSIPSPRLRFGPASILDGACCFSISRRARRIGPERSRFSSRPFSRLPAWELFPRATRFFSNGAIPRNGWCWEFPAWWEA